jgi:asparagine synthase (glutamine-hydrolysing)
MAVFALLAHRDGGAPSPDALQRARLRLAQRATAGSTEIVLPHARAWVGYSLAHEAAHIGDVLARDSDDVLILDGRIGELPRWRATLGLPAHTGAARVVLELLRARGFGALAALRGHFVLARVSAGGAVLHCARDILGLRPLYLRANAKTAAVASEALAVLDLIRQPARPDECSAARYFALRAPMDTASYFDGVDSLPAGACLRLDAGGEVRETLKPTLGADTLRLRDRGEYAQAFGSALIDACDTLLHDEPLAAIALSGGIDSTAIAAAAMQSDGAAVVHAVSWSLPVCEPADEWALAAATARALRIAAHEVRVDRIPTLARAFTAESPIANPYRAIKLAQYAAVHELGAQLLLSGNFGDHGYPDERGWITESWAANRVAPAWRELRSRGAPWRWLADPGVRGALAPLRPRRRSPMPRWLTLRSRRLLGDAPVTPDWMAELPFPSRAQRVFAPETALDAVADTAFADRAGIAVRYPYRDIALLDVLLRVPADMQWRGGEPKALARTWLRGRVPESVRTRAKAGNLTPLFRASVREHERQWVDDMLMHRDAAWPQFVERSALVRAWETRRPGDGDDLLVWLCLGFEAWRRAAAGEGPMLGFRP